jgi:hypothetical protein
MMYDQLHQFANEEEATAVFGDGIVDDMPSAAWDHNGYTVINSQIMLVDPTKDTTDGDGNFIRGVVAASGYWLGVTTDSLDKSEEARQLPSCRIVYTRPDAPMYWKDAVTWSAIPLNNISVASATILAGSGYVFD